jgi:hypothetical protein
MTAKGENERKLEIPEIFIMNEIQEEEVMVLTSILPDSFIFTNEEARGTLTIKLGPII